MLAWPPLGMTSEKVVDPDEKFESATGKKGNRQLRRRKGRVEDMDLSKEKGAGANLRMWGRGVDIYLGVG